MQQPRSLQSTMATEQRSFLSLIALALASFRALRLLYIRIGININSSTRIDYTTASKLGEVNFFIFDSLSKAYKRACIVVSLHIHHHHRKTQAQTQAQHHAPSTINWRRRTCCWSILIYDGLLFRRSSSFQALRSSHNRMLRSLSCTIGPRLHGHELFAHSASVSIWQQQQRVASILVVQDNVW